MVRVFVGILEVIDTLVIILDDSVRIQHARWHCCLHGAFGAAVVALVVAWHLAHMVIHRSHFRCRRSAPDGGEPVLIHWSFRLYLAALTHHILIIERLEHPQLFNLSESGVQVGLRRLSSALDLVVVSERGLGQR